MTKKLLKARTASGLEVTRRTDADYTFAVIGGVQSFHLTHEAAVKAAKRFGGEIVPVEEVGPKDSITLPELARLAKHHGFTVLPEHPVAGGVIHAFVKGAVQVEVLVGPEGEMKGPVFAFRSGTTTHRLTRLSRVAKVLREATD